MYLPSVDKLHLDLPTSAIFHLKLHSSQIHAITIDTCGQGVIQYPPNWTADYIFKDIGHGH
jgi:hypothetical protein